MGTVIENCSIGEITDPIEQLILKILTEDNDSIEIHDLFDKVRENNPSASYEFKYALSHLLANRIVIMNYDGEININY